MNEQDIGRNVENIERKVEVISSRIGGGFTSFWRGILGGFGSVIGAFVAILAIGYFLNFIGFIPALKQQADLWRDTLQQAQHQTVPNK